MDRQSVNGLLDQFLHGSLGLKFVVFVVLLVVIAIMVDILDGPRRKRRAARHKLDNVE